MYIITILYPNDEGATFDREYYRETHLSLVNKAFMPFGLGYGSVLMGEESIDGAPPPFLVTTTLSFPTEEQARAAMASDDAKAVVADISNFTNMSPYIQFNTAVP